MASALDWSRADDRSFVAPVNGADASAWDRLLSAASAQRLDLAALAFALAIRLVMLITFDPLAGYDFVDHFNHINWFRDHFSLPAPNFTRTAYHAPLYHFIAGMAVRLGAGPKALQAGSIAFSSARLALLWFGLRVTLPRSPRARAVALLLAAVLPCSVHLDAMVTQEPLSNLLATATLVLCLVVFRTPHDQRWGRALALGIVAGLALLTKVSNVALAAVVAMAGPLEAALTAKLPIRARVRRLGPWAVAVLAMLAVGGWWYLRSQILYGVPFLSGWDLNPTPETLAANLPNTPELDRRTLGFVFGWSTDIYRSPYYPSGTVPHSRFWPVLIASTFVDYYMSGFGAGYRGSVPEDLGTVARLSVAGGTVIAIVTAAAWIGLAVSLTRRRDPARLLSLMLPLLGVLGQLSFAIKFPFDWEGVIKGIYLHFAVAPLYAVFGVAVAWLWQRRRGRPLAFLALLSMLAVASYTICCRSA